MHYSVRTTTLLRLCLCFIAAFIGILNSSSPLSASPCCTDFNSRGLSEFSACPHAPNIHIRNSNKGRQAPDDRFLELIDRPNASAACGPSCTKDWTAAGPGCIDFCFDVRVIEDACDPTLPACQENDGWVPITPSFQISSGPLRAQFTASKEISDDLGPNGGWHTFCAPVAELDSEGNLPSNEDGQWEMIEGTSDQWTELLTNVDEVILPVDFIPVAGERLGYDNLCFRNTDCPKSCEGICCTGACCVGEQCLQTTQGYCEKNGGSFRGVGSECTLRYCLTAQHCFPTTEGGCEKAGGQLLASRLECSVRQHNPQGPHTGTQ